MEEFLLEAAEPGSVIRTDGCRSCAPFGIGDRHSPASLASSPLAYTVGTSCSRDRQCASNS